MDGEYTISGECGRDQFRTTGGEGQDFNVLSLRIKKIGDCFEGKARNGGKPERAEIRLCRHRREDLRSDRVARDI